MLTAPDKYLRLIVTIFRYFYQLPFYQRFRFTKRKINSPLVILSILYISIYIWKHTHSRETPDHLLLPHGYFNKHLNEIPQANEIARHAAAQKRVENEASERHGSASRDHRTYLASIRSLQPRFDCSIYEIYALAWRVDHVQYTRARSGEEMEIERKRAKRRERERRVRERFRSIAVNPSVRALAREAKKRPNEHSLPLRAFLFLLLSLSPVSLCASRARVCDALYRFLFLCATLSQWIPLSPRLCNSHVARSPFIVWNFSVWQHLIVCVSSLYFIFLLWFRCIPGVVVYTFSISLYVLFFVFA